MLLAAWPRPASLSGARLSFSASFYITRLIQQNVLQSQNYSCVLSKLQTGVASSVAPPRHAEWRSPLLQRLLLHHTAHSTKCIAIAKLFLCSVKTPNISKQVLLAVWPLPATLSGARLSFSASFYVTLHTHVAKMYCNCRIIAVLWLASRKMSGKTKINAHNSSKLKTFFVFCFLLCMCTKWKLC